MTEPRAPRPGSSRHCSAGRPVGRTACTRSIWKRRRPPCLVAPSIQVPLTFPDHHLVRVDERGSKAAWRRRRSSRSRPARRASAACSGLSDGDESTSTARREDPSTASSLVSALGEVALVVGPRTASSARAATARASPSSGVNRRGWASSRRPSATTRSSSTKRSISWSGVYGGTPQQAASSRSWSNSVAETEKRSARSLSGASRDLRQVHEDREQPVQPVAGRRLRGGHGAAR